MKPAKCSECGDEFETSKLLLNHSKSKHYGKGAGI